MSAVRCLLVVAVVCGMQRTSAGRIPSRITWTPAGPPSAPAATGSSNGGGPTTSPSSNFPTAVPSGTLGSTSIPIFLTEGTDLSAIDSEAIERVAASLVFSDTAPAIAKSGASAAATTASDGSFAASTTSSVVNTDRTSFSGSGNAFCDYRCLLGVSCQAGSPLCQVKIPVAGSVYCRFFSGCPQGRPPFSVVYIPLNPFGLARATAPPSSVAKISVVPGGPSSAKAAGASRDFSGGMSSASATSSSSSTTTTQGPGVQDTSGETTASASAGGGAALVFSLPELPENLKPLGSMKGGSTGGDKTELKPAEEGTG